MIELDASQVLTFPQVPHLAGKQRIGVTAGASAPDVLIEGVIQRLRELGASGVGELEGEPENMVFALPKELRLRLVS